MHALQSLNRDYGVYENTWKMGLLIMLQLLKSPYMQYPTVNIQLRGYDYTILESYESYVHKLAENLGIDVSDW